MRAGFDRNGDGELQDEEAAEELVLCNGAVEPENPPDDLGDSGDKGDPEEEEEELSSLVKLTHGAPTVACCGGLVRLEAGIDENANGVLDPEEVHAAQTQELCSAPQDGIVACKHLFVTAATYTGALGGISGADDKCDADVNKPNDGYYKAFLVDGSARVACTTAECSGGFREHVDWVLTPNTRYFRADGTTVIGVTNALGLWSLPLENPYDMPQGPSGPAPADVRIWTGMFVSWESGQTCDAWMSDQALDGHQARRDDTNFGVAGAAISPCSESFPLVCVEQ